MNEYPKFWWKVLGGLFYMFGGEAIIGIDSAWGIVLAFVLFFFGAVLMDVAYGKFD